LQEAVEHADADVVDLLLDHGADEGNTPLSFAVRCGKIDNVRVLLGRRGDQEFSSTMGEIIGRALESNSPDMVDLLLQSSKNASASAKQDMLYKATSDRFIDLRIVELLLESGADPNRKADDGPLTNACYHGRIDVVRTLFAHGAVIEASSDHHIMVALHKAVANGHMEVVRWLLEDRGVAVGDEDPVQGWCSLASAAIPGRHFSMFRYIFERCESRLSHDQLDKILKLAFEQNKIEIAQYLLRETDVAKVTRSRSKPSDFGCKRSSMIKLFRQYQSTSTT
jgi:ankyrin repeat protein